MHMALLAINSFLLVVLAIHYIQVVWELCTVALACSLWVLGQVSRLGNSELGFYFQVFQVLSFLLLSLYIQFKVMVELCWVLEYMLCGVVVALQGCLPVSGKERMLLWESEGTVVFLYCWTLPNPTALMWWMQWRPCMVVFGTF